MYIATSAAATVALSMVDVAMYVYSVALTLYNATFTLSEVASISAGVGGKIFIVAKTRPFAHPVGIVVAKSVQSLSMYPEDVALASCDVAFIPRIVAMSAHIDTTIYAIDTA